jgi:hypothetical protein
MSPGILCPIPSYVVFLLLIDYPLCPALLVLIFNVNVSMYSGEHYYENTRTGETTWDEPDAFKKPVAPVAPVKPQRAAPAVPSRPVAPSVAVTSSIPEPPDFGGGAPPPPPPPGGPSAFGGGASYRDSQPPPPPPPPSATPASPSGGGSGGGDLLSQIRAGKELRKGATPAARAAPAAASGTGLNDALKTSLDRYFSFFPYYYCILRCSCDALSYHVIL